MTAAREPGDLAITAGAGRPIDLAMRGPTPAPRTSARRSNRDGLAVSVTPGSSGAVAWRETIADDGNPDRGHAWRWRPIEDVK